MSSVIKFFEGLGLALLSVVITLGVLELGARLLIKEKPRTPYEYRLQQPEPYKGASYFSPDFINESFFHAKWINPQGTRILIPGNYKGKYFNVEENRRKTTGVPSEFQNIIHVFRGSTVYCSEVPDSLTIPSYLQSFLNERKPNKWKVINYGATSVNTSQQLQLLKTTSLREGDIVIFYGGVNESILFTTGRPDGWVLNETYVEYDKSFNFAQKISFRIYQRLSKYSKFVGHFLYPYKDVIPQRFYEDDWVSETKKKMVSITFNQTMEADSFCSKFGATFINILQPHILTKSHLSSYEMHLLNNEYLIPSYINLALKYSYEALEESMRLSSQKGVINKWN
jgi:hypothetical protein